ncbi:MAG: NAD(P)-dependent oxidoreductase [Sterolibacteriaceae bacterium]|nr:NAD(P)-dependent oxidoreductase [Candidatus Methylophosphatis haderslevensis]
MRVGFIGLGAMGRQMAGHLLRGGHQLSVFARRAEAAAPLVEAGARACTTPAEVARNADVVFTMVTSNADVEQVTLGADGIVQGAAAGSVVVDMSTIAPSTARRIAQGLAARGIDMLDAPVSGGTAGAAAATLAIMVGGRREVLERVRPLFDLLGKTIVHIGDHGAGQVAKACNQIIMVSVLEAAAEALHLANAAGVDAAKVREALLGGSAQSRVLDLFGARMVARDFRPGVEARLHHKDFGLVLREAADLGVPLPISAQVWQQLNALMGRGMAHDDTASLLRVLEAQSRSGETGDS